LWLALLSQAASTAFCRPHRIDWLQGPLLSVIISSRDVTAYFEDAKTREPVRFEQITNQGHVETWTFFEFDAGNQDPDIFIVPVDKSTCNAPPTLAHSAHSSHKI